MIDRAAIDVAVARLAAALEAVDAPASIDLDELLLLLQHDPHHTPGGGQGRGRVSISVRNTEHVDVAAFIRRVTDIDVLVPVSLRATRQLAGATAKK